MIYEALSEEEKYLFAILQDDSGLDQAEFAFIDETQEDRIFRAWPVQVFWWRNKAQKQIEAGCFAEGQMVLTSEGHKPIEEVQVGDLVFTHMNRWRPVTAVIDNGMREIVELDIQGAPLPLRVTKNHQFWGRHFFLEQWIAVEDIIWGETEFSKPAGTESGKSWVAPHSVSDGGLAHVWDLEVEEDHSFTICGFFVHNSRSIGKSLGLRFRAFAFPFTHPGDEMVITAPEGVHLDAVTDNIESLFLNTRLAREMIAAGRGGIKHRPFMINLQSGGRIMGRIPQHDSRGIKGCVEQSSLVLTKDGLKPAIDVTTDDEVWTHENRWQPVLENQIFETDECWEVKGQGGFTTICTDHHRFYSRVNLKQGGKKALGPLGWEIASDLPSEAYWAIPILPSSEVLEALPIDDSLIVDGDFMFGKIYESKPTGETHTVCNIVTEDHSYTANNVVHHNTHPVILEVDEAQDMPASFWKEVVETVKLEDNPRAMWRCIAEGQLVLTSEGHKPIEEIEVGDQVLTHEGRWRPVTEVWNNGVQECVTVNEQLTLTENHKILVRQSDQISDLEWMTVREALNNPGAYWGTFLFSIYDESPIRVWHRVWKADPAGPLNTYDLTVEEDHSYVVEGIIVSNCHGVTRGVGDDFDARCQPDSGWQVHRLPAMYRPTWSERERESKIKEYGGSTEAVDYRRNILGLSGDAQSTVFVAARLGECMDTDKESVYNDAVYTYINIDDALLNDMNGDIVSLLDLPASHLKFRNVWIGVDPGWTVNPTAVMIFAEESKPKSDPTLRLIARIKMTRISAPHQTAAFIHLLDTYRPRALALDSTGAGLPLLQGIQDAARQNPDIKHIVPRIKGYNFSEKIIVEFDDTAEVNKFDPEGWKDAAIKQDVLEASTNVLRRLVDEHRMILPYDTELFGEFRGQTWAYSRKIAGQGRRKLFSAGEYHFLDAARMAALAFDQQLIELFIKEKEGDGWEPPPTIFL